MANKFPGVTEQRRHAHRQSSGSGHVYQGRFKSFPIQENDNFHTACRYVERNARRANLVRRAEDCHLGLESTLRPRGRPKKDISES